MKCFYIFLAFLFFSCSVNVDLKSEQSSENRTLKEGGQSKDIFLFERINEIQVVDESSDNSDGGKVFPEENGILRDNPIQDEGYKREEKVQGLEEFHVEILREDVSVKEFVKSGPTMVCGTLPLKNIWSEAGSPYIVECLSTIPSHGILDISAGVEIIFRKGGQLVIKGELKALGTKDKPIQFLTSRQSKPIKKEGLVFNKSTGSLKVLKGKYISGNILRNTTFAGFPSCGIYFSSSKLFIENSKISKNEKGLCGDIGEVFLNGTTIKDNKREGIQVLAKLTISGSLIESNGSIGVLAGGSSFIEKTTIRNNKSSGLFLSSDDVKIKFSRIVKNQSGNNSCAGIQISSTNRAVGVVIENNIIEGNKGVECAGIALTSGAAIRYNNIENIGKYDVYINTGNRFVVNAKSNYWGTKTTNEMKQKGINANITKIRDSHDSPQIQARVIFENFSSKPFTIP